MNKCCGKSRSSQFCPDCGKQLDDGSGLLGLIRQLRVNAKAQLTHAQKHKDNLPDKYGHPNYRLKRIKSHEDAAQKFVTWADGVEKLIKESESTNDN